MKKKHPNVTKNNQEGSRKMRQGRGSWTPRCTKEVVKRLGLINHCFQSNAPYLSLLFWFLSAQDKQCHVRMSHVKWTGHSTWTQSASVKDKNLIAHRRIETLLAAGATNTTDHTKYQRDALNIIYSSNILLYMFRVSSTHLQEDTVVCEQHMVPSLSIES